MKIGTIVSLHTLAQVEEGFCKLKEMGFDSCQLNSWEPKDWTDENAEGIARLAQKHGIVISSFWCGWEGPRVWNFYEGQKTLGLVPPEYREIRVKNLMDGADFALKFGVTDVVTHMGYIPENPYDANFEPVCDAIRTVAEHLKAQGQNLLFETGQETPVTLLRCFETVGTGNLYVNLDTANLIMYGKANPVDALEVIGPWVRNLHAKDGLYPTNGKNLGKEVRLGDGKVDFRALFQKLHQLGYDSWVTIEREIAGEEQTADIRYAQEYLQSLVDEIYLGK